MRRWLIVLLCLSPLAGLLPVGMFAALADGTSDSAVKSNDTGKSNDSGKKANKTELPGFTAEREAAAITFVKMHHPELADLLARLKQHSRTEYERAIRELFRTSERLAQYQEKNAQRYEFELQNWKLGSRVQVLSAKLAMNADPVLKQELREVLRERAELKRNQLQAERDRTAARLAELERELKQDMNVTVDQQVEQLVQGTQEQKKQRDEKRKKESVDKSGAKK